MTDYDIDEQLVAATDEAIDEEQDIAFDVAAMNGQMFHNVKHMGWFWDAVHEEIRRRSFNYRPTTNNE